MEIHPARLPVDELVKQCRFSSTRRGGPGGQHRNKVETAVLVEHLPTGIKAEANELRSQGENRVRAVYRLRLALAAELRMPSQPGPSELMRSRTSGEKLQVSERHDDFAALLAEALDVLQDLEDDVPAAAKRLGLSSSQLIGLIRMCPPAMLALNQRRAGRGMHPLR